MMKRKREGGEGKEKEGKKEKKGEERGEKSIRGIIITKSATQGGGKMYFPPICTVPTWGKNIISGRAGGRM